jgi:predicted cobalt transporter CbtA
MRLRPEGVAMAGGGQPGLRVGGGGPALAVVGAVILLVPVAQAWRERGGVAARKHGPPKASVAAAVIPDYTDWAGADGLQRVAVR